MTVLQAWILAAGLAAIGFAGSWIIGPEFLAMVGLYFALQVAYMAGLKNLVIIDMLVIALGFTVRAVAGAAAIDVPVSPWLVICTGLLALFLAAAKRRHELLLLGDDAGSHRPVLTEYSANCSTASWSRSPRRRSPRTASTRSSKAADPATR